MSGNVDVPRHFIEQAFNELCPPTAGTLIRNRLIKQFLGIASNEEKRDNAKKFPLRVLTQQSGRPPTVETASRKRCDVKQYARKLYDASLHQTSGALEKEEQEEHASPTEEVFENMEEESLSWKDALGSMETEDEEGGLEEDSVDVCENKDYSSKDGLLPMEVEEEDEQAVLEGVSCIWKVLSDGGQKVSVPLEEKIFKALAPVPESVREDRAKHSKYWPPCLVVCLVLQACVLRHHLLGGFSKVNTLPECFWDGWDMVGKGKNRKYMRQKCKYQDNQRIQPSMLQRVFQDEGTPFIMLVRSLSHANLMTFVWDGSKVTATWYATDHKPMHDQYKEDIEKDLREAFRQAGQMGDLHIGWESPQIPLQTNNWDCVIYTSVLADRLSRGVGYEDLDEPKVASYRLRIIEFLRSLGFNEDRPTLDDF